MYGQLAGDHEILHFSRNYGANWHCEPMGRLDVELKMLDYFEDRLSKLATLENLTSFAEALLEYNMECPGS